MDKATELVLWLFVLFLGIAFGAGVYESRVVVPRWTTSPEGVDRWEREAAVRDDTGRKFWVSFTTLPLTFLTLLSLTLAWRAPGALRTWWLGAAGVALVERIITISYFIPAMARLMRLADSAEARFAAMQWARWNYVRHFAVLVAWLLALKAFATLYGKHR